MIATIELNGEKATLEDGGKWTSPDPEFQRYLNLLFGPDTIEPSPSAGFSEYCGQARALEEKGAKVVWAKFKDVPNRVY